MSFLLRFVLECVALAVGMVLVAEVAWRVSRLRRPAPAEVSEIAGPVIGATFALLGLLVAFTFHGAHARFDARRDLIVEETNAIGTAWLRLELLPEDARASVRAKLRRYAERRAALYGDLTNEPAARAGIAEAEGLARDMWAEVVEATRSPDQQSARVVVLPALNEMFDIVTRRTVAIQTDPPAAIMAALYALALTCAALVGSRPGTGGASRRAYTVMFAVVMASVLFLVHDMEHPRIGVVRLDDVNQLLIDLSHAMP